MTEGFDLLHPVVQHHIVNSLGWSELRPLQEQAIRPLLNGEDALLLAPTAGGKTEAALFPLLSRMAEQGMAWDLGVVHLSVAGAAEQPGTADCRLHRVAGTIDRTAPR